MARFGIFQPEACMLGLAAMPKEKQVEIRKLRFGLRLKLTVGLVLIIGIIIAAQNVFTIVTQQRAMRAEVMLSSATVGRVVLASLTDKLPHTDIDDPALKAFLNNFMSVAIITNPNNKDMRSTLSGVTRCCCGQHARVVTPPGLPMREIQRISARNSSDEPR